MALLECKPDEYSRAFALYRDDPSASALLPRAVLRGLQPGRVFVDRDQEPRAAFVINRFGFCCLVGRETEGFHADLKQQLATEGNLGRYLLWYSPPDAWASELDELVPAGVRRRERVRFEFIPELATYVDQPEQCPQGLELRDLTAALLPSTQALKVDIESRFWPSGQAFLEQGIGVGLFRGDEIVSLCYSACVVDGRAEIDVATPTADRSQGFASIVAREFVRACRRKGITPAWDAFSENEGSVRLAGKLGFRPQVRYAFYTFQTPLGFSERARGG